MKEQERLMVAVLILMVAVFFGSWPAIASAQRLDVELDQWTLGFEQAEFAAGRLEIWVVNNGRMPHNLRIDWEDSAGYAYAVETPVLQSGESYRLILALAEGTYNAWCLIPGHADLGMHGVIRISSH